MPGSSIKNYDFSSPQKAVESQFKIESSGDMRAGFELALIQQTCNNHVELDSLKFRKTVYIDNNIGVFAQWKDGGIDKHVVKWLSKSVDDKGKVWYFSVYVPTYGWEDKGEEKKAVKEMIDKWEHTGS